MPVQTGRLVARRKSGRELAPWGAVEAGGFLLLGSLSPWISAIAFSGSTRVTGTQAVAELTFVLGLIVAGMAAIHLAGYLDRRVAMWGVIGASATAGIAATVELIHLHSRLTAISASSAGVANIGNGLYLTCLAAVAALVAGIFMQSRTTTSESTRSTPFDGEVPSPAV
jgi:hypothetical protein